MKGITILGPGKAAVTERAEPRQRDDYVKVKTVALALNPTDWKHIDYLADEGALVGCDYSGIVLEVGKNVKADVKKGDRIWGAVHGSNRSNHEDGGFAEIIVAKDGMFGKVPEGMSMTDAATLGTGVTTVGQSMYQALALPLPSEPAKTPFPILIYGGSTATGTLAIQFAKLSGLDVVTTASPKHHEMLKSLGASACFDYNDPECGEKIRAYTNDNLRYALDTIALGPSITICAAALSSNTKETNRYTSLLPVEFPRDDVKHGYTMAYTAMGEAYTKRGRETPAKPEDYKFSIGFAALASKLLAEGKIKPHPAKVGKGLEGVLEGLQEMREGKVSGVKLVYEV